MLEKDVFHLSQVLEDCFILGINRRPGNKLEVLIRDDVKKRIAQRKIWMWLEATCKENESSADKNPASNCLSTLAWADLAKMQVPEDKI